MEHITRGEHITRKYSLGIGQADGPETDGDPGDGKNIAGGAGGCYDQGVCPEE